MRDLVGQMYISAWFSQLDWELPLVDIGDAASNLGSDGEDFGR